MKDNVVNRFLKYVGFETTSDGSVKKCPSTEGQLILAEYLVNELKEMGLKEVVVDQNGYVFASLPANTKKKVEILGFLAHMDTSPDASGKDAHPQIVKNYDGENITLNKEKDIYLSSEDFPELKNYVGQDLITTDGRTLLGSDDKAGIAEIMSAMEYLVGHPEIEHGEIKVAFTPDEEIGRGADLFDVKKFGADYAYTVDGGKLGEFSYENFNASTIEVEITGVQVHPGTSKNKTINALHLAMEYHGMLPIHERPEITENHEGFYQLISLEGGVATANMKYIIRDHDLSLNKKRKEIMQSCADFLHTKYDHKIDIQLKIEDSYYNMAEKVLPYKEILVDNAINAMKEADIKPLVEPTRGGTDGSRLSFMGLPCPNIFTGGHNFHGIYEYIPISSMEKAVEVIINISKNWVKSR